ncbi:MAG: four helix bundle protein [Bacteroidota bacterium]
MYNLSSHIRRAGDSIALNVAEGSSGQSNPEFKGLLVLRFVSRLPSPVFGLRTPDF